MPGGLDGDELTAFYWGSWGFCSPSGGCCKRCRKDGDADNIIWKILDSEEIERGIKWSNREIRSGLTGCDLPYLVLSCL